MFKGTLLGLQKKQPTGDGVLPNAHGEGSHAVPLSTKEKRIAGEKSLVNYYLLAGKKGNRGIYFLLRTTVQLPYFQVSIPRKEKRGDKKGNKRPLKALIITGGGDCKVTEVDGPGQTDVYLVSNSYRQQAEGMTPFFWKKKGVNGSKGVGAVERKRFAR